MGDSPREDIADAVDRGYLGVLCLIFKSNVIVFVFKSREEIADRGYLGVFPHRLHQGVWLAHVYSLQLLESN